MNKVGFDSKAGLSLTNHISRLEDEILSFRDEVLLELGLPSDHKIWLDQKNFMSSPFDYKICQKRLDSVLQTDRYKEFIALCKTNKDVNFISEKFDPDTLEKFVVNLAVLKDEFGLPYRLFISCRSVLSVDIDINLMEINELLPNRARRDALIDRVKLAVSRCSADGCVIFPP